MSKLETDHLKLGYIPLLDCVALLWADHRGFFLEQGLNVELVKEASWASLRDRLAFGFLDAAHCLSAMLPAAAIGYDQLGIPFQTPLILSQSHAFITLSQKLCFDLDIHKNEGATSSSEKMMKALKNDQHVRLANVFKHSIHHYCLREWLALADEKVAKQIQLHTLPPPYMVEALTSNTIDGFCVSEPWNTQAEILGIGHIIQSSQNIIPPVADKVLAVTQDWAIQHPNTLHALCQALIKAQHELKQSHFSVQVWQLLINYNIIQFECSEILHVEKYHAIQNIVQNLVSDDVLPKVKDFEWLIHQMIKWENIQIDNNLVNHFAQNCIISMNK